MIEFSQNHPILSVLIVFGVSLIAMVVIMLSTDHEDNDEPPYGI